MRHQSSRSSCHVLSRLLRGGSIPCLSLALVTACGADSADGGPVGTLTSSVIDGDPGSSGAGGSDGSSNSGAGGSDGSSSASGAGGSDGSGSSGVGSSGGTGGPPGACGLSGATVERAYAPKLFAAGADPSRDAECSGVLNPERGVFRFTDLRSLGSLSHLRGEGYTLIYGKVLIDDYRTRDIDQRLITQLHAGFAAVRSAGLKVLPRFYYADTGTAPDAPLSRVLSHIEQLKPVLEQNADVIAVLHPGFVGAWGEWHSSTNDLTNPASREQIFDALLEALPSDRMTLARRPSHKLEAYGGPLTEETAFSGAPLSRVGHLNDCFLASDDDVGTYQLPGEKDYAIADSAFTPVGGETCGTNPPRSQCGSALDELSLHHWSFINTDYHTDVVDGWRSEGCFETIACRLGYRFAVMGHESPEQVARGQSLSLRLRLFNDGYARAYNPRPVYLVLQQGEARRVVQVDADPRRWAPGEESELCLGAQLPADLPPGDYQLGLWLPDGSERLRDDPRYAIQLSSGATWDGASGVNLLDATVRVVE
ncbi:DUF4832 domain-containing protein [Sorangium sp. So ce134]